MAFNYRHHYMMLSDSQKSLYELLYKKISSYSGNIKLPLVHSNELWLVFEAVLLDNPFMIQCDSYSYQKDLNKRRIIMMPDYKFPSRINAQYQAAISSSLAFVGAGQQKSDYDKALHIHDYILSNFTYDYSASENCHTALGLAVNKKGVCEGLAKYVKLAMDALSLKSIIVIGHARNPTFEQYENEAHAWNMVEVNGQWYHFDVTFDLTLKGKMHRYDYFLTGDEEVKKNHSFGGNYPRASTVPLDYYTVNGLSANNLTGLGKLIYNAVISGQRIMQFKLLNAQSISDPSQAVLQEVDRQCQQVLNCSYAMEVRYNDTLLVFEIEITY